MLAAAVVLTGDAGADTFYVQNQGGSVAFYQNATPATGSPVQVVPLSNLGPVTIDGGGGGDTLTLDYAGGSLAPAGLTFDAGTPTTGAPAAHPTSAGIGPGAVPFDAGKACPGPPPV